MKDTLNLDWSLWFYGLFAGFIGGGAAAIVSGPVAALIAPKEINMDHPSKLFAVMLINFAFSGVISTFMYLAKHPLPDIQTVTTTTTATSGPGTTPTLTTKVEETHVEQRPTDASPK
jgi:hypothetical protein